MNLFSLIAIILASACLIKASSICYDTYACFDDDDFFLPEEPTKIATKFYLFNRNNINAGEQIQKDSFRTFREDLPTKVIIHGFKGNTSKSWIQDIKSELLKKENVNVILVDWSGGNGHPYSKAVGNTQIVAIEIANLINSLMTENKSVKPQDFHLIGYSLGAHIAGIVGLKVPGIGRITGLDPTSFYYTDKSAKFKLDSSDAEFVDVIHTDGSKNIGMGTRDRMGHVDFYPNGGKDQPGCKRANEKLFTSAITWITGSDKDAYSEFSCSHQSARRFFTDSISQKCKYTAYPCTSSENDDASSEYDDFKDGECIKCSDKGCNQMGYWASKYKDNGRLYLNTRSLDETDSYCLEHYQLRMVSNSLEGQSKARGKFRIFWKVKDYISPTFLIHDETMTLKPHEETKMLIKLEKAAPSEIEEVYISYKRTSNYLIKYFYDQNWSFEFVELIEGGTQRSVRFCPLLEIIKSGTTGIFKKCP